MNAPQPQSGRVAFRCDAAHAVGMGHFARCSAVASWLDREEVWFVVATDQAFDAGRMHRLPYPFSEDDEIAWWRAQDVQPDVIVFDISHQARLARRTATRDLILGVAGEHTRRVIIDGLGAQMLVEQGGAWPVDTVVVPYAGASSQQRGARVLCGPDYFVVPRAWGAPPRRDHSGLPHRLLITMGGSDPFGITIRALEAASLAAGPDWSIRVIVGPAFSPELVLEIRRRGLSDSRIQLVAAPASMAPHLAWADCAIAATGLTKYELAWAGVPSVQVSIDRLHAELNTSFATAQTAIHLGPIENVDVPSIAAALGELAGDLERRVAMTRNGQRLVDGQGGARLAREIRELIDAGA